MKIVNLQDGHSKDREGYITYPHIDYEINLAAALIFIKNIMSELLEGMMVYIAGSHGYENSILWITWQGGPEIKRGSYAFPIMLHQPNGALKREIGAVFNATYELVKRYLKKTGI